MVHELRSRENIEFNKLQFSFEYKYISLMNISRIISLANYIIVINVNSKCQIMKVKIKICIWIIQNYDIEIWFITYYIPSSQTIQVISGKILQSSHHTHTPILHRHTSLVPPPPLPDPPPPPPFTHVNSPSIKLTHTLKSDELSSS